AALRLTVTAEGPDHLKTVLDRDLERALAWYDRRARARVALSVLASLFAPIVIAVAVATLLRAGSSPAAIGQTLAAGVLGLILLPFSLSPLRPPSPSAASIAERALGHVLTITGLVAIKRGCSPAAVEEQVRSLLPAQPHRAVRAAA